MFYYIPDWLKWFKRQPKPVPDPLSEIIKKRALEQNAIIDRPDEKKEVELLPSPVD